VRELERELELVIGGVVCNDLVFVGRRKLEQR
jgi:hypothetical protein